MNYKQPETLSLFPQQQQQLQPGMMGIMGMPPMSGINGDGTTPFITDGTNKFYPQGKTVLNPAKQEDNELLEMEAKLRGFINNNDETEIYNFLNSNMRKFSKHPFAYFYLAYDKPLTWLTSNKSGLEFLSSRNNFAIVDNIKDVLKKRGVSPAIITMIQTKQTEGIEKQGVEAAVAGIAGDWGRKNLISPELAAKLEPKT
jgi:hypothetical protein